MKSVYKYLFCFLLLTGFSVSGCSNNTIEEEEEFSEPVRMTSVPSYDLNSDGSINGFDWDLMTHEQKNGVLKNYTDKVYRSLNIKPPEDEQNKEIIRVRQALNSYYRNLLPTDYFPSSRKNEELWDAFLHVK